MLEGKSKSSLLSDCTKGLVGALNTKLEEKDEDRDGARDLVCESRKSGVGQDDSENFDTLWNGEKLRGGEVAIQASDELYSSDSDS
jgi:hypothetical protein